MKYLQSGAAWMNAAPGHQRDSSELYLRVPQLLTSNRCWWDTDLPLLCVQNDWFGIQTMEGARGWRLRVSEQYRWPLQRPRRYFCRGHQNGVTLGVTGASWGNGCSAVLNGLSTWETPTQHFFLFDRVTQFIPNKTIWSYSGPTLKHFANGFRIIIPNLQSSRIRLRQEIRLVQSQTMRWHWKLILWDPPGLLFTEQHTWNKDFPPHSPFLHF